MFNVCTCVCVCVCVCLCVCVDNELIASLLFLLITEYFSKTVLDTCVTRTKFQEVSEEPGLEVQEGLKVL